MGSTPIHRIRVTRLCETCGVNRSTFYDHFHDVYDVVATIERELLRELDALADEIRAGEMPESEICLAFLRFFSDRRKVARALLQSEVGPRVTGELEARTSALFAEGVARSYDLGSASAGEALRFVSAGFYRLYGDVIMADDPPSDDDLRRRAELGAQLSSAGLERCLGGARDRAR